MKHYKDKENKLYALDSSEFEYLLPAGYVEITEQEAEALKPQPTILEKRAAMVLTPMQARLKLKAAGLLTVVEAAIAALLVDDDIRIMWEYSTELHRLNPVLIQFCKETLNLNDAQIDALFS